MSPVVFEAPRTVRTLNIAAVGLALSAATAAIFASLTPDFSGLVVGVSTLVVGVLWAWTLRLPNTVARSHVRWGWLVSVPLSAMNAAFAGGLFFALTEQGKAPILRFAWGAAAGATFGVIFWGPALVLTLLFFGAPIAWAQRLAKRGLAGEERGEWIVGLVCALLGAAALALSFFHAPRVPGDEPLRPMGVMEWGLVFTKVVAVLATIAGASATLLSHARERRRRAFVRRAESGEIPGFRVDPSPEGKVLVRVSSRGEGYRVADFSEEIFLLDEEGRATKARALELPR